VFRPASVEGTRARERFFPAIFPPHLPRPEGNADDVGFAAGEGEDALSAAADHDRWVRPLLWAWALLFVLSTVVSVFATATRFADDTQGIANNTVAIIVAYLLALGAVMATEKLFEGFERKPVERPAHRWVVVADDGTGAPGSAPAVELAGEEPAA